MTAVVMTALGWLPSFNDDIMGLVRDASRTEVLAGVLDFVAEGKNSSGGGDGKTVGESVRGFSKKPG